jgi:glycopeptide antibiotics resistance protein
MSRNRLLGIRAAYIVIILIATLTGLRFSPSQTDALMRLQRAFAPAETWRAAVDALRNLVLFAGLGAVWVATSLDRRTSRDVKQVAVISFVLSTIIEGVQTFSPARTASIIDVVMNTLGGIAGAVAAAKLVSTVGGARKERSYIGVPALLIAGPYALAVACEALTPLFNSAELPAFQGDPARRLLASLSASFPLDYRQIPISDIPLYAAAGFLLVAYFRESRGASRTSWWTVSAVAAVVVLVLHVLHGAFGLPIRWEAILTDVMSIFAGAWLADRSLGHLTQRYRGATRARGVIVSYAILLMIWGWRPLLPKASWEEMAAQVTVNAFLPLEGIGGRVDVFSAAHVLQQFFLYVPLGALLGVWPLRRRGPWSNLLPAFWLALVIEAGHIVVEDRTFDLTNALLVWSGLAMGWICVRQTGYRPYGEAAPAQT